MCWKASVACSSTILLIVTNLGSERKRSLSFKIWDCLDGLTISPVEVLRVEVFLLFLEVDIVGEEDLFLLLLLFLAIR